MAQPGLTPEQLSSLISYGNIQDDRQAQMAAMQLFSLPQQDFPEQMDPSRFTTMLRSYLSQKGMTATANLEVAGTTGVWNTAFADPNFRTWINEVAAPMETTNTKWTTSEVKFNRTLLDDAADGTTGTGVTYEEKSYHWAIEFKRKHITVNLTTLGTAKGMLVYLGSLRQMALSILETQYMTFLNALPAAAQRVAEEIIHHMREEPDLFTEYYTSRAAMGDFLRKQDKHPNPLELLGTHMKNALMGQLADRNSGANISFIVSELVRDHVNHAVEVVFNNTGVALTPGSPQTMTTTGTVSEMTTRIAGTYAPTATHNLALLSGPYTHGGCFDLYPPQLNAHTAKLFTSAQYDRQVTDHDTLRRMTLRFSEAMKAAMPWADDGTPRRLSIDDSIFYGGRPGAARGAMGMDWRYRAVHSQVGNVKSVELVRRFSHMDPEKYGDENYISAAASVAEFFRKNGVDLEGGVQAGRDVVAASERVSVDDARPFFYDIKNLERLFPATGKSWGGAQSEMRAGVAKYDPTVRLIKTPLGDSTGLKVPPFIGTFETMAWFAETAGAGWDAQLVEKANKCVNTIHKAVRLLKMGIPSSLYLNPDLLAPTMGYEATPEAVLFQEFVSGVRLGLFLSFSPATATPRDRVGAPAGAVEDGVPGSVREYLVGKIDAVVDDAVRRLGATRGGTDPLSILVFNLDTIKGLLERGEGQTKPLVFAAINLLATISNEGLTAAIEPNENAALKILKIRGLEKAYKEKITEWAAYEGPTEKEASSDPKKPLTVAAKTILNNAATLNNSVRTLVQEGAEAYSGSRNELDNKTFVLLPVTVGPLMASKIAESSFNVYFTSVNSPELTPSTKQDVMRALENMNDLPPHLLTCALNVPPPRFSSGGYATPFMGLHFETRPFRYEDAPDFYGGYLEGAQNSPAVGSMNDLKDVAASPQAHVWAHWAASMATTETYQVFPLLWSSIAMHEGAIDALYKSNIILPFKARVLQPRRTHMAEAVYVLQDGGTALQLVFGNRSFQPSVDSHTMMMTIGYNASHGILFKQWQALVGTPAALIRQPISGGGGGYARTHMDMNPDTAIIRAGEGRPSLIAVLVPLGEDQAPVISLQGWGRISDGNQIYVSNRNGAPTTCAAADLEDRFGFSRVTPAQSMSARNNGLSAVDPTREANMACPPSDQWVRTETGDFDAYRQGADDLAPFNTDTAARKRRTDLKYLSDEDKIGYGCKAARPDQNEVEGMRERVWRMYA